MRVYHGAPSPENLRRCRQAAPSHVHGACWTPAKMTTHEWPYFIDNGAFTSDFDRDEWVDILDSVEDKMPHPPDFVVLPDAFNDAEETIKRHRRHVIDVVDRGFNAAPVIQPGMPISTQVAIADGVGADFIFVGGECRWQRAHAVEIVDEAHDRGISVHIGNPGSADGLVWAYRTGFDSVDTSSILQNQYFHWLEQLESETAGLSRESPIKGGRQTDLKQAANAGESE